MSLDSVDLIRPDVHVCIFLQTTEERNALSQLFPLCMQRNVIDLGNYNFYYLQIGGTVA